MEYSNLRPLQTTFRTSEAEETAVSADGDETTFFPLYQL
jgi:hypothetical protein